MTAPHHTHVAIIGGGLAGTLLARQLRLYAPHLTVTVFEKSTTTSYKVGESTVEIATHYLIKRQQLGTYMYDQHLPKNGLRYFFDTPEKDLPFMEMSELGTPSLPLHPSYQIDRLRFEADLRRMNLDAGVPFHTGVKVKDLAICREGDADHHFLALAEDGTSTAWSCRWLVDCSGRARVLQRALGMPMLPTGHPTAAVWGRFRGVVDMDAVDPRDPQARAWRERVRWTQRFLSTNHFCYPGYWIWFIPLRYGVTSVGVVGTKDVFPKGWTSEEGFLAWMRSHRAVRDLLEGSEIMDLGSYGVVPYGTERFLGTNRWAMTGESAAFSDPFYSPGSDYIALENDFVSDLIQRESAGEDRTAIEHRTELYEAYLQFRFRATMLLYQDQYPVLGSYRLMKLKYEFDLPAYYNIWYHPYFMDHHLDDKWLAEQLYQRDYVLTAMTKFRDLFVAIQQRLMADGRYYAENRGRYNGGYDTLLPILDQIAVPRRRRDERRVTRDIFNAVRKRAVELLDLPGLADDGAPRPLYDYFGDDAIVTF